jgi:hypothetical protein
MVQLKTKNRSKKWTHVYQNEVITHYFTNSSRTISLNR